MTRSSSLALVVALVVVPTVAMLGCRSKSHSQGQAGPAQEPATQPFILVLNWLPEPEFGGFYAAQATGAFAKEGLAVTIKAGGPGVPSLQMVATGQADAGITGADEMLLARIRGADVVPIFAVYQHSPQALMTREERGVKTLAEVFAGGTVAMEPGLPYALFLKAKYGFAKVKVVPYDGGIARLLLEGDYAQQCYLTSEPLAAARAGTKTRVFPISDEGYDPYGAVVVVRREVFEKEPARVASFVRAAQAGWALYLAAPEAANSAMHKLNRAMDLETFDAAAAAQRALVATPETKAHGLGSMSRSRWKELAETLKGLGLGADLAPGPTWPLY